MKRFAILLSVIAMLAVSAPAYCGDALPGDLQTKMIDKMDKGYVVGSSGDTDTLMFMTKDGRYFKYTMKKGAIIKAYETNEKEYKDLRPVQ